MSAFHICPLCLNGALPGLGPSEEHVAIPRAQYEALMAAAKDWMFEHPSHAESDRCQCSECKPLNEIYDGLCAAGIQIEEEDDEGVDEPQVGKKEK